MTKMMDILEDYLTRKFYKFFRLDGSCSIGNNMPIYIIFF
jgi:SNF2 family DNA or RNA helicase